MDFLHNYRGFGSEIEENFKDLILEFDLNIKEPYEGTYLLIGKECALRFAYDRGDIAYFFLKILVNLFDSEYHVYSIYKYLFPYEKPISLNDKGDWNTKKQLRSCAINIESKLKFIFNGDFTWVDGYLEN